MKLFWLRKKPHPPPERPTAEHDAAAMDAIGRAQDNMDEGTIHLQEIEARRKRLDRIRYENHWAPQINDAFRGRKSE